VCAALGNEEKRKMVVLVSRKYLLFIYFAILFALIHAGRKVFYQTVCCFNAFDFI
jgi:hypothetical protein